MTKPYYVELVNRQTGEAVERFAFDTEREQLRCYNYYVFNLDHVNYDLQAN